MPRAATISHQSPDYLIDIVADGLIRVLGRHNVHLNYRIGGLRWDMRVPQLFHGFEGFNSFIPEQADCLITSVRLDPMLIDQWTAQTGLTTVAVIDGEDDDAIREDFRRRAKVYFKREFMKGFSYLTNVRPLPFAAIPEASAAVGEKSRCVFFRATNSDPWRSAMTAELRALGHEVIADQIPKADYNTLLASSVVGPSVRGAGWDTYRYWEVPYFGSVLLSQRLSLVIENDFVEGEEAMFFDSLPEFRSKLAWLLEHRREAERLATAGHQKCVEKHLSTHRAATVLEAVL